jgi:hypothetical protein
MVLSRLLLTWSLLIRFRRVAHHRHSSRCYPANERGTLGVPATVMAQASSNFVMQRSRQRFVLEGIGTAELARRRQRDEVRSRRLRQQGDTDVARQCSDGHRPRVQRRSVGPGHEPDPRRALYVRLRSSDFDFGRA